MEDKDTELPVAYIAALTQISRFAPDAFEQKSDVIMTYLIKRVLMVPSPVDPVSYYHLSFCCCPLAYRRLFLLRS